MKNIFLTVLLLVFASIFVIGCGQKTAFDSSSPILIGQKSKAETFETAQKVLESMHFTIEKSDLEAGIIRTRPLSGANLLEMWRSDSATARDLMYSSIHSIQKTAQIDYHQSNNNAGLSCIVEVQRLSLPSRSITGFDDLPLAFSNSSGSMQKLNISEKHQSDMTWVHQGRDENLEQKILKMIEKRLEEQQEKK